MLTALGVLMAEVEFVRFGRLFHEAVFGHRFRL